MQDIVGIFEPETTGLPGTGIGKLGVEIQGCAPGVIIELTIDAQPGIRPDFLDKQALSPAGVSNDDIRGETPLCQCQGCMEAGFCAYRLGLEVCHPGVNFTGCASRRLVPVNFYSLPILWQVVTQGQHHNPVTGFRRQRRGQVLELTGEILVDKQYVHL
jgi:hypothetical protein